MALFGSGDFRGAAIEAHAVVEYGGKPDQSTIRDLLGNKATYRAQLRKLETFVRQKPGAADAQFLLGFQFLSVDRPTDARSHLAKAIAATPNDKIARQLLDSARGTTGHGKRTVQ